MLIMLCVALEVQKGMLGKNKKCYKERWNKGTVIESDECKLCWDFEYHLRKTTSGRRTDVTIEYKNKNNIFLIDMACPNENMSKRKQCGMKACTEVTKTPITHIRDYRQANRLQ